MVENPSAKVRVGVRELRGNLTRYLSLASSGSSILVTSRDVVIAEIRPPSAKLRTPRKSGTLRGQIQMADDFDILPADLIDAMEQ